MKIEKRDHLSEDDIIELEVIYTDDIEPDYISYGSQKHPKGNQINVKEFVDYIDDVVRQLKASTKLAELRIEPREINEQMKKAHVSLSNLGLYANMHVHNYLEINGAEDGLQKVLEALEVPFSKSVYPAHPENPMLTYYLSLIRNTWQVEKPMLQAIAEIIINASGMKRNPKDAVKDL